MFRLSKAIEKLEDRATRRFGKLYDRHKKKLKYWIPLGLCADYFYGMIINSITLGIQSTFGDAPVESIWVANPFMNLFAVFTPMGLVITAAGVLIFCLITKKGFIFFSGYKFTHDARGFDILPDGTHGTSGFLTKKEMVGLVQVGPIAETDGVVLGKLKDDPEDNDKYAEYVSFNGISGLNGNILVVGAPGSYKTTGFIIPFALQCAKRKESIFHTDPKGELYAQLSEFYRKSGYEVKVFNLINMEHSDSWNCLAGLEDDPIAVQSVANVIIQNTSGPNEKEDFWSRAEINLLEALLHYVSRLTVGNTDILAPIERRSLGEVYRLLSGQTIEEINALISGLPDDHPAHAPHGNFLKAKENLWGNIAIGLGNRLAVFQSRSVDQITRGNDIDLLLPGQKPCAYFCIISAQDSTFRFLSSLFFTMCATQLSHYAQAYGKGQKLPLTVNFCLDEYLNIGHLEGMSDMLGSCRGFNINIQAVVQSLSQYQFRYPHQEWELQEGSFDLLIYMGCNDITTARILAERCGKITITVVNNQMPMMPLFSPILNSTRPYSQTRSNTARDLMQTDEILRLDRKKELVIQRGEKPMLLYKLAPGEHPLSAQLEETPIMDYIPDWQKKEQGSGSTPRAVHDHIRETSQSVSSHVEDTASQSAHQQWKTERQSYRPKREVPAVGSPGRPPSYTVVMPVRQDRVPPHADGESDQSAPQPAMQTNPDCEPEQIAPMTPAPSGGITAKVKQRRPEEVDPENMLSGGWKP